MAENKITKPTSTADLSSQLDQQVENVSHWVDVITEFAVTYGFTILGAVVFWLIGLRVASWAAQKVAKLLEAKEIDVTLARFIGNVVRVVMMVLLVIITLGNFGISTAPLIALAGASAFGATMAIQGPLSNYGAGVAIILTRPFTVGNTITVNRDNSGVVEDITLAHTILIGEDGEKITIPNKEIVGRVIVNSHQRRVVQTKIALADEADVDQAIKIVREALSGFTDIQEGPESQIGIHDFAYGGVILGLRFWAPSKRYFELRYQVNEAAFKALKAAGIPFMAPVPQAVIGTSLSADDDEDEQVFEPPR